MKLREMNTDQLAEALCEMGDAVDSICKDKSIDAEMKRLYEDFKGGSMTVLEKTSRMMKIWLPALLKTHKAEVYKILSVLTGKSPQEIAEQNGMQTIREARECIDGELMAFFSSFANMG